MGRKADPDYPQFHKIPRWNRPWTITEKIDGTNGLIYIGGKVPPGAGADTHHSVTLGPEGNVRVMAGSKNRWLSPDRDNQGFSAWVTENAETLTLDLGEGYHYGEWWGEGIQRGYGMKGNVFSLFNTRRWKESQSQWLSPGLAVVPVVTGGETGHSISFAIEFALDYLRVNGSMAADWPDPEGIVLFHWAANGMFKVTLKDDELPKSQACAEHASPLSRVAQ